MSGQFPYYAYRWPTPAWANLAAIDAVYNKARMLTRATGVEHHVHHVVPVGAAPDIVCGLHVADNLRIMTRAEHRFHHSVHDGAWPNGPELPEYSHAEAEDWRFYLRYLGYVFSPRTPAS